MQKQRQKITTVLFNTALRFASTISKLEDIAEISVVVTLASKVMDIYSKSSKILLLKEDKIFFDEIDKEILNYFIEKLTKQQQVPKEQGEFTPEEKSEDKEFEITEDEIAVAKIYLATYDAKKTKKSQAIEVEDDEELTKKKAKALRRYIKKYDVKTQLLK